MAVALDTSSTTFNNTADSNTITLAHTCSGSDRLLLVATLTDFDASPSVTYNGVSMTLVDSQTDGSGSQIISLFKLVAPVTGGANIVLSKTSSWGGILATSWTGVSSTATGTTQKASGTSASPTVTISTTASDMAVSFVFGNNPTTFTANNSQTKISGPNFNPGLMDAGYVLAGTTLSWTLNTSQSYALLGVPVLSGTQTATNHNLTLLGVGA